MKSRFKKLKAGYYENRFKQLAIVYPDQTVEVFIDPSQLPKIAMAFNLTEQKWSSRFKIPYDRPAVSYQIQSLKFLGPL